MTKGSIEQEEEADDWEKEEWELVGDNLVSKEKLGHWSKELNVEELVGDRVEKKEEEVEGKVGRVGWLAEAKEVGD